MDNMEKYAFKVCLAFKTKQSDWVISDILYYFATPAFSFVALTLSNKICLIIFKHYQGSVVVIVWKVFKFSTCR